MAQNSGMYKLLLYSLVLFSGFANLATEIIGPRLVASLFGSTTIIWAIIISVTLIGISVGYFLGGRVPHDRVLKVLPVILILNAIWLLLISWMVWEIPARVASVGYFSIGMIAILSFFPPAVLFSMVSPLAISLRAASRPVEAIPREVGNIYAIGTVGSVLGALAAAFLLIPWVGLSTSLKIFSLCLVLFAIVFLSPRLRVLSAILLLIVIIFPQPFFSWGQDFSAVLLEQTEGYYQTIRVYTDNSTYMRMDLGPTFHARMSLADKEPMLGYAIEMLNAAGDVQGKKILIIGGAGHTQARALEKRGATVVEVEIDPFVINLSDKYFGKINGDVVTADGRAFLEQLEGERFDLILVDAFDGLASVPTQLTTREFFEAADRALKPDGRLIFNFIGVPSGEHSNSFRALSETMASVFSEARASEIEADHLVNIILVASQSALDDLGYPQAPRGGTLLTDDLNPVEIYFEQARADYYYR